VPGAEDAAIRLSIVSIIISLGALIVSEVAARHMRQARVAH
jgi:hypothetical protein